MCRVCPPARESCHAIVWLLARHPLRRLPPRRIRLRASERQVPQVQPYHQHHDTRNGHDHYYPDRGSIVRDLPQGATVVSYAGLSYRFQDGVWYEPRGPAFMVVDPPIGLIVQTLPTFVTVIARHGETLLYANDVYYRPRPDVGGYEVVNDPAEPPLTAESGMPGTLRRYPSRGGNAWCRRSRSSVGSRRSSGHGAGRRAPTVFAVPAESAVPGRSRQVCTRRSSRWFDPNCGPRGGTGFRGDGSTRCSGGDPAIRGTDNSNWDARGEPAPALRRLGRPQCARLLCLLLRQRRLFPVAPAAAPLAAPAVALRLPRLCRLLRQRLRPRDCGSPRSGTSRGARLRLGGDIQPWPARRPRQPRPQPRPR